MTAFILQEKLVKELGNITKDMILKNTRGEDQQYTIFSQELPLMEDQYINDEDEILGEEPMFPYIIVKIDGGQSDSPEQGQRITTRIIIGTYDDDRRRQGHKVILNTMQRFRERFRKNPMLSSFHMNDKIEWALQEEDSYPFYFGAIEVSWNTSIIKREDKYS